MKRRRPCVRGREPPRREPPAEDARKTPERGEVQTPGPLVPTADAGPPFTPRVYPARLPREFTPRIYPARLPRAFTRRVYPARLPRAFTPLSIAPPRRERSTVPAFPSRAPRAARGV